LNGTREGKAAIESERQIDNERIKGCGNGGRSVLQ